MKGGNTGTFEEHSHDEKWLTGHNGRAPKTTRGTLPTCRSLLALSGTGTSVTRSSASGQQLVKQIDLFLQIIPRVLGLVLVKG